MAVLGMDLEELKCIICLDFVTDAVETDCCHKIGCENCLTPMLGGQCPCCKADHFKFRASIVIRRMLGNMGIQCPNDCGQTTSRSELTTHLKLCQKGSFTCPFDDCEFTGNKAEFGNHLNDNHQWQMIEGVMMSFNDKIECPIPDCTMEPSSGKDFSGHVTQVHADILKRIDTIECPFCSEQVRIDKKSMKEHIEKNHLKLEGIDISCHFTEKGLISIQNGTGKDVTMGSNGKFYCKTKQGQINCQAPGNNCIDCMKVDISFRKLTFGRLVNQNGVVCKTNDLVTSDDKNKNLKFDCGKAIVGSYTPARWNCNDCSKQQSKSTDVCSSPNHECTACRDINYHTYYNGIWS